MIKKIILISGGSDGLGKAIAAQLSSTHQVIILSHNEEKLKQASLDLGCDYVTADVSDFDSLTAAVKQVISKYQRIDVLVNNAGIWLPGNLTDNDPAKIKEILMVNTLGTIYLSKAVLPTLLSQGGGRIINIISQDGLNAKKERSVYTASKWAITGFTKCLQDDLSDQGIGVTGVYPGLMKTKLFAKQGEDRDLHEALDLPNVAKLIEFVINLPADTLLPEIGIKSLPTSNHMDNTSAPVPDLNINPDLMATTSNSPAITPDPSTPMTSTPTATSSDSGMPPFKGVIDITPGASDASHPSPVTDITPSNIAMTTPGIKLPVDKGVIDITPSDSSSSAIPDAGVHLSDILPESPSSAVESASASEVASSTLPAPDLTTQTMEASPATVTPAAMSETSTSTPLIPTTTAPTPETPTTQAPANPTSPFAEDPNQVQLGK